MNQIKLYFLTGFLGSGKTTLLKNLLENMEGMKVGVIQNELGKISIEWNRYYRMMTFTW